MKYSTVPNLGGIRILKMNMACQTSIPKRNKEMSLFDLQTVTFWQLKNAPRIADFETFKKSDPGSPPSVIGYTYLSTIEACFRSRRFPIEIISSADI
jgi:hypothetical protein